jgi:hypothetical protein
MYDSVQLPWLDFIDSLEKLQYNELVMRLVYTSHSNPASYYDDTECYRTLAELIRGPNRDCSISAVLGLVRSKLSTKPDDKVYSLYGILDSLQFSELLKVDYSRPVHETYTEMAIAVINSEKSLDILYHACVPQLIPHLPSWVPDWSNAAYFRPIRVASSHASGSSNPSYSFSKRTRLAVKGIIIDSIRHTAPSTSIAMPTFRRGYNARMNVLKVAQRYNGVIELVRTLQEWAKLGLHLVVYSTDIAPRKALCNVLVQNAILGVFTVHRYEPQVAINKCMAITIASSSDFEILQKIVQNTPEYAETLTDFSLSLGISPEISMWPVELQIRFFLRLVNSKVTLVQHEIFLNTYHKTLIVTKEGDIGTCPRWAKPGDLVLLVAGLQTPRAGRWWRVSNDWAGVCEEGNK